MRSRETSTRWDAGALPPGAAPLAMALVCAAVACGAPAGGAARQSAPPENLAPYEPEEIHRQRDERDRRYRLEADSPIPAADRPSFRGLSYYGIDADLAFVVKLDRYDEPVPVTMVTTEGMLRPAVKLGFVSFDHEGSAHRLQVYQLRDQSAEQWNSLFLPFRDETTGTETYGAGRYVDLVAARNDWYLLDFNLAYHPLCAYGRTGYQCPRTPDENRLPFAVRAGERLPEATVMTGAADDTTRERGSRDAAGPSEVTRR